MCFGWRRISFRTPAECQSVRTTAERPARVVALVTGGLSAWHMPDREGWGGQNNLLVVCVVSSLTLMAIPFAWRGLLQRAVPCIFVTMLGLTPLA